MKTLHSPHPDYETTAYLLVCFAITAAWVIALARFGLRLLESPL